MDKTKQIQLITGTHVGTGLQYANAEASLVKKIKNKEAFGLDMNTDQSLLEFSIFYPEAGFSKSKLFFGTFLIREDAGKWLHEEATNP